MKHKMLLDSGNELDFFPIPYGDYIEVTPEVQEIIEGKMKRKNGKVQKKDLVGHISVSVDTKRDIRELYGCLATDHKRFRNECEWAKESGCQLYILTENEDGVTSIDNFHRWKNKEGYKRYSWLRHRANLRGWEPPKPPVPNASLVKTMRTMEDKYGVRFLFCKPDETAGQIEGLLRGGET